MSYVVECFQPSLDMSYKLCISSSYTGSFSSIHVSGRTYHRSIHMPDSSCTMLGGDFLPFHSCQYVRRHSSLVSYQKNVLGGLVLQGLQLLHLSLWWLRDVSVQTRILFLSLVGSGRGCSIISNKSLPAVLEVIVCSRQCIKQCQIYL